MRKFGVSPACTRPLNRIPRDTLPRLTLFFLSLPCMRDGAAVDLRRHILAGHAGLPSHGQHASLIVTPEPALIVVVAPAVRPRPVYRERSESKGSRGVVAVAMADPRVLCLLPGLCHGRAHDVQDCHGR